MTGTIHLSRNIAAQRKAQGLTQEDVATYLGVTKASVSKWECGQSFPDIALLPQLATYFGVTIDALMGYQPQMSKSAIRHAYLDLRKQFADKAFDEAHGACERMIRDYWSCAPLLVQMAVLYLNHLPLATQAGEQDALIDEAVGLCRRARRLTDDAFQVRQATAVEAMFELTRGHASQAESLLAGAAEPSMGEQTVLVQALLAQGKSAEAQQLAQVNVYQAVIGLMNDLPALATLSAAEPERLQEIWHRTRQLIDAFDLEHVYVNCAAVYLSFAATFAQAEQREQAYACLANYVRLCGSASFPLKLEADDFFDKVGPWLEALDLGDNAPRDESLIKQSMVSGLEQNPAFAGLSGDSRFASLIVDLKARLS